MPQISGKSNRSLFQYEMSLKGVPYFQYEMSLKGAPPFEYGMSLTAPLFLFMMGGCKHS